LLVKLAFKNLFRNKLRTIVSISSLAFGLAALIFYDSVIYGINNSLINSASSSFIGELQIHNKYFLERYEKKYVINDHENLISKLKEEANVKNFSLRLVSSVIISSGFNQKQSILYGINLKDEKKTSLIKEAIYKGIYEQINEEEIILGYKLASILNVKVGDNLVISCDDDKNNLVQHLIKVAAIVKFNQDELDAKFSFVSYAYLENMLNLKNKAHEIAVNFYDINKIDNKFIEKYSINNNIARAWYDIFKELEVLLKIIAYSINIIAFGLFLIIGIGIINTIFMSFHERKYEYSMIKALGAKNKNVVKLIIMENFFISIFSILFGIIIAIIVISYFKAYGINYSGLEITNVNFKDKLYPVLYYLSFLKFSFALLIYSTLISIIPAIYSSKLLVAYEIKK